MRIFQAFDQLCLELLTSAAIELAPFLESFIQEAQLKGRQA